jgi:class 3 adenylate cyclase/tetratricopeptide (TPR) repeat protein
VSEPGVRRLVTVLFTDIVRSTEHVERLGDSRWSELLSEHDTIVRDHLAAFGGQEVSTTGDGFLAVFDLPGSAVRCASAIARAMAPLHLDVRAGIHTGEVMFVHGDARGRAAHIGARVMAAAQGGEVLVTNTVRELVAGSDLVFEDRGDFDLRGLQEPINLYALHVDAATATPPERTREPGARPALGRLQAPSAPLVGRAGELTQLRAAWERARSGDRQAVFVTGEPGIGKTRLATEIALEAERDGAIVLFGRCDQDLDVPYQPFVEALGEYVAHCPDADLRAHARRHGAQLARLVPAFAHRLPMLAPLAPADPATERYRLFEACADLLVSASSTHAMLLLLDDVQWAAKPTLLLLRHILRSTEPMALLVLATYRSDEVGMMPSVSDVLADICGEDGVEQLSVEGLTEPEAVDFITSAAGHDLDTRGVELARTLRRETNGNPFFIIQILRHLASAGSLVQRDGRWTYSGPLGALAIPPTLREVVTKRLRRLPPDAYRALQSAAVIGHDFDLAILAAILRWRDDRLLEALERADRAGLVTEVAGVDHRFAFSHALIRNAIIDGLSVARRAHVHRRVAEEIEAHDGDEDGHLPELAHHWLAAAPSPSFGRAEVERATMYGRRAAGRAARLQAYDEAARLYASTLAVLERMQPDAETLMNDLRLALGDAQWRDGNVPASRKTFLEAAGVARRLGDREQLGRAALGYPTGLGGGVVRVGVVDATLVSLLEEAALALEPDDSAVRVQVVARLAMELYFSGSPRSRELSTVALEMARRVSDQRALAAALNARHYAEWGPDDLIERLSLGAELVSVAEAGGDKELALEGHHWRVADLLESGDTRGMGREIERTTQLANELRQPRFLWYLAVWQVMRALLEGRVAEVPALMGDARAMGEKAEDPNSELSLAAQAFVLSWTVGTLDQSIPRIESLVEQHPALHGWRCVLALAYTESGRQHEARRTFEEVMAMNGGVLPRDLFWMLCMSLLAETASRLGDQERSARLYEQFVPFNGRYVNIGMVPSASVGSTSRYLGLLATTFGDLEQASAHFERAIESHMSASARPWLARSQHDYAAALLRRGRPHDHERAVNLLVTSLGTSKEIGMAGLRRSIEGALSTEHITAPR